MDSKDLVSSLLVLTQDPSSVNYEILYFEVYFVFPVRFGNGISL